MNSDNMKWLIAGLAGSLLCILLMVGGGFLLFRFAAEQMANVENYSGNKLPSPKRKRRRSRRTWNPPDCWIAIRWSHYTMTPDQDFMTRGTLTKWSGG